MYYNPSIFSKTIDRIKKSYEEKEESIKDEKEKEKNREYVEKIDQLLSRPPKTWTDFVEIIKLVTVKKDTTIELAGAALGTSKVATSQDILYLLLMQNGTQIISNNVSLATFNLPTTTSTGQDDLPGKRALEFYTSFASPNSPNYTWNDNLGNEIEAFANQKVAIIFGYSSLQNYLLQKYPNIQFDYKKAYVPQVSQEADKITDYTRFTAYGVSAKSTKPSLAWSLVKKISTQYSEILNSANRLTTAQKELISLQLENQTSRIKNQNERE